MPFLYQIDASGAALQHWELCVRQRFVVGRLPFADTRLGDGCLSSKHFSLRWNGDSLEMEALGLRKETWVNGERVTKARLQFNDEVRAGYKHFCLEASLATMIGELLRSAPATTAKKLVITFFPV